MASKNVVVDYTNYKGQRSEREILPLCLVFKQSKWHEGEQWILKCFDVEKKANREFAVKDIHSWAQVVRDGQAS